MTMEPADLRLSRHPILVTGSIRSGTTWLGRLLASCDNAFYIHEPFNPDSIWNGAFPTPISHFYIDPRCGDVYRPRFHKLLRLQPRFPGPWMEQVREHKRRYIENHIKGFDPARPYTPIVKDPIALYSSEWLQTSFRMIPVVLVRHPVSVMKSLLRLGWAEKLQGFVQYGQPLLLERLCRIDPAFERYADRRYWDTDQPLQRALNYVRFNSHFMAAMKIAHPQWEFVSYERLTTDRAALMALIERVGLTPSAETRHIVYQQEDRFDPDLAHQHSLAPRTLEPDALYRSDSFCDHWRALYHQHFDFLPAHFPEMAALQF